ncbi:TonB-dependent receptor [Terricaulis sp.]|uniref:TonB-dependent receptor n=1 Tax=Terricaulis sp. TaxID=2768686 RepID=UPI002AC70E1E|nr:TonB-dependent receptor [Terricaulis sp.]MDZ4691486.1 TonB-dependent receptor [Terricaulis sp.]
MRTFGWILAAAALCASPAFAQESDEIVVTAAKHGEARAQDLPITMNAFSADDLRERNVEDLQSLSYAMPNVQFEDVGTARGVANYSIRGVGINSSIASVDPAVGLFIDGMYVGVNAGSLTDMFDVEAVEVLRGPQGALYGRNVTGGAVLVRTRAPTDVFEAHGRVAVETGTNFITEAAISGPLAEGVLAGRLSIYRADDDGWLENDFDGSSFGRNETSIYRAALRFTPSADFEALLRVEQGNIHGDGPAGQNHALFDRGSFDFAIDNRGYAATDWEQAILEMNWRVGFGDGVITSISGWRNVEVPWAADIDSTSSFVFHTRVLNAQSQRSQELRYAGSFGAFDVTSGVYYLDQDLLYIDERNFSPTFRRVGGGQGEFTTWAAFTNVDWNASEALTLSAGLRYTHEEKDSRISRVRRAIDDLNGPGVIVLGEGVVGGDIDARTLNFSDAPFQQDWDDLSPRVGVQWRPSEATNIYANWSRAFRGGGANFRTASLGLAPRAYEPEQQSTFEIGWKQELGRGRVNAALFHNTIENMQRETNQPDPISGVQQIVLNAGDAVIWGGEIEARFDVTDRFTVAAHAGYVEGEYDSITEDLNGDIVISAADYALEIPRLAPWTYGVSVSYTAPIAGGEGSAHLSYNHRDAAFYNDSNLGRLAEADMIDANLTYAPASGRWRISLYGENLLDEATWGGDTVLPSTAAFGFSGGERPTFSPLNKGRVLGIELRATY